jgi:RNA polymerase sigma factor (sigma-70 family)
MVPAEAPAAVDSGPAGILSVEAMDSTTPPAALETLLAEREWVRTLARTLVLDVNDADDLEQQAWVAALTAPPADAGSPRGWLATVMRRAAGKGRRRETRLDRRERGAARPEATMGTADLVALAEQHRRVVGLVLDLEEPFRGALLARYFEGLAPRDIAARSGEPVKTVASRLARGLERIRERLDRESKGDRRAWCASLAPLAGLPWPLPAPRVAPARPPAAGPAAATGGAVLSTGWKVGLVATVVLATAGTLAWLSSREPAREESSPPAVADAGPAPAAGLAASPREAPRPPASEGAPASAPPVEREEPRKPGESVGLVVVEIVDGKPKGIPQARFSGVTGPGFPLSGVTDAEGSGAVPIASEAGLVLWVWADGYASKHLVFDAIPGAVEVVLERGRAVHVAFESSGSRLAPEAARARYEAPGMRHVILVPPDQAEAGSVREMVRRMSSAPSAWQTTATLEFAGDDVRLSRALDGAGWLLSVARPGDDPYLAPVREGPDGRLEAVVPLRDPVPRVRVRLVEAESGRPLASAALLPYAEAGDDFLFVEGGLVVADAGGEAELPRPGPVGPGNRSPTWWAVSAGRLAEVEPWRLRQAPEGGLEVRVPRTATVRGRAWLEDGTPAAGRVVTSGRKGRFFTTVVAADGTFELRDVAALEPGPGVESRARVALIEDLATMAVSFAMVPVTPGAVVETRIGRPAEEGRPARVVGRITAGGKPLAGVLVHFGLAAGDRSAAMASTKADGTYRVEPAPAGEGRIQVLLGESGISDDAYVRGQTTLRLDAGGELRADFDLPGGAIRVRVVDDATGKPVPGALVMTKPEERGVEAGRFPGYVLAAGWCAAVGADGSALLPGLPLGAGHRVEAILKDRSRQARTEAPLLPGTMDAPAEVVLRLK